MALSGTFQNYPVSSFGLYCEWSGAQSVTANYTDVTLKVYLSYYTLDVGARSDSTISINGVSETYTVPAIEDYSSGWKKKLLKTKTVRVSHNADGTKSGVALSASWRFSGTYSGVSIGTITASTTVTLNSIDRSAPTVSCSVSSITANGFKISASSSATADLWQYSLNGVLPGRSSPPRRGPAPASPFPRFRPTPPTRCGYGQESAPTRCMAPLPQYPPRPWEARCF